MAEPELPDDAVVTDGPDWRNVEAEEPEIWNMLLDIEALDRVIAVMNGPATPGSLIVPVVRDFLQHSAREHRIALSVMIAKRYGVPVTETEASPFSNAGKPRAFGVETGPPPA